MARHDEVRNFLAALKDASEHLPQLQIGQLLDNAIEYQKAMSNGQGPDLFCITNEDLTHALFAYSHSFKRK
jgi:hypothetical protein